MDRLLDEVHDQRSEDHHADERYGKCHGVRAQDAPNVPVSEAGAQGCKDGAHHEGDDPRHIRSEGDAGEFVR